MPVILSNLKERGYFKTVINLEDAFDPKDPTQADLAEEWKGAEITIRELNARETADYQKQAQDGVVDNLADVIVGHNFQRENGKQASNQEVADVIMRSSTVYLYVITEWMNALPLAKRSKGDSAK